MDQIQHEKHSITRPKRCFWVRPLQTPKDQRETHANRQDAPASPWVYPVQLQQTPISGGCLHDDQLPWCRPKAPTEQCQWEINTLIEDSISVQQEEPSERANHCLRPLLWNSEDLWPAPEERLQARDPLHRRWNPRQIHLYDRCAELPKIPDGRPRHHLRFDVSKARAAHLSQLHQNDQPPYRWGKEVCQ